MGTTKPSPEERVKIGIETFKNHPIDKSFNEYYLEVRKHVETCLKPLSELPGYEASNIEYRILNVDLSKQEDFTTKVGECIFVQFTEDGHVVVIGAGHDYGMPTSDEYIGVNIINKLGTKWSKNAILIFITGIRPVPVGSRGKGSGIEGLEHEFQSRNIIEMYIGEYILKQGITILDKYSHKNYTKDYLLGVIEKNFDDDNIKKLMFLN